MNRIIDVDGDITFEPSQRTRKFERKLKQYKFNISNDHKEKPLDKISIVTKSKGGVINA